MGRKWGVLVRVPLLGEQDCYLSTHLEPSNLMLVIETPRLVEDEFEVLLSPSNGEEAKSRLAWLFTACGRLDYPLGTKTLVQSIVQVIRSQDPISSQSSLNELLGDSDIAMELLVDVLGKYEMLKSISDDEIQSFNEVSASTRVHPPSSQSNNDPRPPGAIDWLLESGFSESYLAQERLLGLQKNRLASTDTWKDNLNPEDTLVYHEKVGLPAGTERKNGVGFEEVFIPAPPRLPKADPRDLIDISSLEDWAQKAFPGTKSLNRIQSVVFETAYHSAENMLVCAPTGAGKTNIAMLTFLRLVKQNIFEGHLDRDNVKAVYIAPMKALAQEVVAKFSERLKPLGFLVREFTGIFMFYFFRNLNYFRRYAAHQGRGRQQSSYCHYSGEVGRGHKKGRRGLSWNPGLSHYY